MTVDANACAGRRRPARDAARTRLEIVRRILGIEPAFDRLSAIREASFQARRHRRTDIRRELGYSPELDLQAGLEQTAAGYR